MPLPAWSTVFACLWLLTCAFLEYADVVHSTCRLTVKRTVPFACLPASVRERHGRYQGPVSYMQHMMRAGRYASCRLPHVAGTVHACATKVKHKQQSAARVPACPSLCAVLHATSNPTAVGPSMRIFIESRSSQTLICLRVRLPLFL